MNDHSARAALPLLYAGQAQKEMTHNEALTLIDLLLSGAVETIGSNTAPVNPEIGRCWIIGDAPQGEWASHPHCLAGWTGGGWRFVAPFEGLRLLVADIAVEAVWRDGAWRTGELRGNGLWIDGDRVVAGRQPAIADPDGGSVIDVQARMAIAAIAETLRNHGLTA